MYGYGHGSANNFPSYTPDYSGYPSLEGPDLMRGVPEEVTFMEPEEEGGPFNGNYSAAEFLGAGMYDQPDVWIDG